MARHRAPAGAGSWNADYWFGQVRVHPIFPALREAAAAIGIDVGPQWKPAAFIELCEKACSAPGSELERQALAVQRPNGNCCSTTAPPRDQPPPG